LVEKFVFVAAKSGNFSEIEAALGGPQFTSDPSNTKDMELRDERNLETILNCQDCLLVIHECKTGMQS
jgi:hypothetical protein